MGELVIISGLILMMLRVSLFWMVIFVVGGCGGRNFMILVWSFLCMGMDFDLLLWIVVVVKIERRSIVFMGWSVLIGCVWVCFGVFVFWEW